MSEISHTPVTLESIPYGTEQYKKLRPNMNFENDKIPYPIAKNGAI